MNTRTKSRQTMQTKKNLLIGNLEHHSYGIVNSINLLIGNPKHYGYRIGGSKRLGNKLLIKK